MLNFAFCVLLVSTVWASIAMCSASETIVGRDWPTIRQKEFWIDMLGDDTRKLHPAAMISLAEFSNHRTFRLLFEAVTCSTSETVVAQDSLITLRKEFWIDVLNNVDRALLPAAMDNLAEFCDHRAFRALFEAVAGRGRYLYSDGPAAVEYWCQKCKDIPVVDEAMETLISGLDSESYFVRTAAAKGLGELRSVEAIEHLVDAMKTGSWRSPFSMGGSLDRSYCPLTPPAEALVKIGTPAVELLVEALGDMDWGNRCVAASVLGEIGDPSAIEPLIIAIGASMRGTQSHYRPDENESLRICAIKALDGLDPDWCITATAQRTVFCLIESTRSTGSKMRIAAAIALGDMKMEEALGPLTELLSDPKTETRVEAIRALENLGNPRVIESLTGALHDPNERVRRRAIQAMGEIGDPQAIESLTGLIHDPNEKIKLRAIQALGEMGDPRAIEPLHQLLESGAQGVTEATIAALDRIGHDWRTSDATVVMVHSMVQALFDRLESPKLILSLPEDSTVAAAARVLGGMKIGEAVEPLCELLEIPEAGISVEAAIALGKIRDRIAMKPLLSQLGSEYAAMNKAVFNALDRIDPRWHSRLDSDEVLPRLIRSLGDDDHSDRILIRRLMSVGAVSIPHLISAMKTEKNSRARMAILGILCRLEAPEALETLLYALTESDPIVQKRSLWLLNKHYPGWQRNDASAANAPTWIEELKDGDPIIQIGAIAGFVATRDSHAIESIIATLEDRSSAVRKASAQALEVFDDPRAVMPLIARLKDKSSAVRGSAITALGAIGDTRATEPLARLMRKKSFFPRLGRYPGPFFVFWGKAESPGLRGMAARALGEIGDPDACESLGESIRDKGEQPSVIMSSIAALGEIGGTRAVAELLRATEEVRASQGIGSLSSLRVVEALEIIGGEQAISALTEILHDPDQLGFVQTEATAALERIGDPAILEPMLRALEHPNPRVRQIAAQALGKTGDRRATAGLVGALTDDNEKVRRLADEALEKIDGLGGVGARPHI